MTGELRFGDPGWLNLVWMAIGIFVFFWFWDAFLFYRTQKAFGLKNGIFLTGTVSRFKRRLHAFLQCAALIFFAIALARPQLGSRLQEEKQMGVEMIIAVDVSTSMLAEDDKPSRLEHAKHELSNFVDQLSGDRIGLIAFAGSALLVSPLTNDHSAIKMYLSSLTTESVSTQGTNFKEVLDEAVRGFERGGAEGASGGKPTRVLLIASDGEDNEPGADSEIKKAVEQGIKIFGLGFGSPKGAPIPLRDEHGNVTGYKKDRSGQPVLSVPSDEGMAKLSRLGEGSYYHSSFDELEVKSLVRDIDHLQKVDFKTRLAAEYEEKYQIPLLIALIFAFLDLSFGERRKVSRQWRGRFQAASILLAIILGQEARAFGPPAVDANNNGVDHYKSEKYQESFNEFAQALGRDPFNSFYHFNLGDAFYKNGELDKAILEYDAVEKDPKADQYLKFKAMFNAGNAAVDGKKIPEALKYYQKALEYDSNSLETKTNIELALKEQQGGGGGENQNQNQNQEQKQKQKQKQNDSKDQKEPNKGNNEQQKQQPTPRPTPRPFDSKNLSENDVRRILEELKRQEQEIRSRQDKVRKPAPEKPIDKDW